MCHSIRSRARPVIFRFPDLDAASICVFVLPPAGLFGGDHAAPLVLAGVPGGVQAGVHCALSLLCTPALRACSCCPCMHARARACLPDVGKQWCACFVMLALLVPHKPPIGTLTCLHRQGPLFMAPPPHPLPTNAMHNKHPQECACTCTHAPAHANTHAPASLQVIHKLLSRGTSVVLCPGGVREVLYMEKGKEVVFLRQRKGFVK